MARKRKSKEETRKVDALIERLREFVRFDYITAGEVAREIGVHDSSVYSWLLSQARPAEPKRVAAFLDSLPRQKGSGRFIYFLVCFGRLGLLTCRLERIMFLGRPLSRSKPVAPHRGSPASA